MPFIHLVTLCLTSLLVSAHPIDTEYEFHKRQDLSQVITTCTTPNTVAITFDDGPYSYTKELVDLLDRNNIKATFFYNGNNWRCIYDQDMMDNVKYVYEHGHQVASHTWHHWDLSTLSWDQIHDEMWRVEQALQRIVGVNPAFMRPPYGNYNDLVRQASAARGQRIVNWDFDSGDAAGSTPEQSQAAYSNLVSRHPSTCIALNHEVKKGTVHQVIPYAIEQLRNAGYNFATVADCLGLPAYQSIGSPQTPDVSFYFSGLSNVSRPIE
ncbi:carbohydrate esterase family 4 protein [Dendrothele bispora CBS 962.96]|uniref:Carbohydrate esterase family 4 protein n=1 Tax=Dendrothele bispora (strain CBS 962.96) TaxID=1314807 RepID=A0A4S8LB63_DENBC|nr:carbohydrate esterase family 4 protein [Dendrothele bispora CBS 962.96]